MKVVCITLDYMNSNTTIGKTYDIINWHDDDILIENDCGVVRYYNKKLFKDISILREERLNEILK
jgi:hypothetical protein